MSIAARIPMVLRKLTDEKDVVSGEGATREFRRSVGVRVGPAYDDIVEG